MAVTQHKYIRIEAAKFGRKGLIYVAACLAAALLVCMLAGALGPAMLSVQNGGTEELVVDKHGRTELVLDVHGFNPMNQFYWIDVEFRPRSGILYEQINSVDITLNVTGSNALVLFDGDRHIVQNRVFSRAVTCTKKKCEKFFLFGQRQIFFESLKIEMLFTDPDSTFVEGNRLIVAVDVVTIGPEYTKFEMVWKDIFLVITLFVLFTKDYGYLWKLVAVSTRLWSSQQIWILGLLSGLIMFNDPFFSLQILTKYALEFSDFYIVMTVLFITNLLMFWLCNFDELRLGEGGPRDGGNPYATRRNLIIFLGPKGALMVSLFGLLIWMYTYLNKQRDDDPTYDGTGDDVLWNGEVALTSLVVVYSLYLFGLIVLNIDKIRAFLPPFMFIFMLTMITVVFTLVALVSGYFFPFNVPAMLFVLFYSVINLYIWAMAFSYCPFRDTDAYKYQLSASAAFGEDYFDEVFPPSALSRERIGNDKAPLIVDKTDDTSSANELSTDDGREHSFRHRFNFGIGLGEAIKAEKEKNKIELKTLGSSRSVVTVPSVVGEKEDVDTASEHRSDALKSLGGPVHVPRAPTSQRTRSNLRLDDFASIEFS